MKKLLVFLLLNMVLATVWWYYRLPNIIERVRSSVVYVRVQRKSGQRVGGSGMVVGDRLIMTAAHVIKDANNVCIEFDDGTKIKVFEFFTVKTIDTGLIVIKNVIDPLCFSWFKSNPGDMIFTVGSPYGFKNCVATGIFSNYVYINDERLHQLDINGAPGMSGCPVFNRYGSVIGILVRGNCRGMIFIVPAETCQFVIDVYENVQRQKVK